MANYNYTRVKCGNPERFAEILKDNPFTGVHSGAYREDAPVTIGEDGWAKIYSRNSLPLNEIQELSEYNPGLAITAEFSTEGDLHVVTHVIEFKDGVGNETEQKINYGMVTRPDDTGHVELMLGDHYNKLMDRAVELFKRMDTVVRNGNSVVEFIPDEIQLTVKNDKYGLAVKKDGYLIEAVKGYKKRVVTTETWDELKTTDVPDDLPF